MKSRPVTFAILGLALGMLIVLLLVSILQTRMLVGEVRNTQKTNTGTVKLIRDCTEPSGKCFKRGQKQTANAVTDINKISVYAAACADQSGVQSASEIYACVVGRLAKDKP